MYTYVEPNSKIWISTPNIIKHLEGLNILLVPPPNYTVHYASMTHDTNLKILKLQFFENLKVTEHL
jgi:hypothetical protein